MKIRVSGIKYPPEETLHVALKQENETEVLLVLVDSDGQEIKDSDIIRLLPDWKTKKLKVARIVGRTHLSSYIELDRNGQVATS